MSKYRAVNNLAVTQDLEIDNNLIVKNMVDCVILNTTTINATTVDITDLDVTNLDVDIINAATGNITDLDVTNLDVTNLDITNLDVTHLDVTGDIGVGTTSPAARLHIINTANRDCFRVDDQASDTTVFTITATGQVAIGMEPNTIFPSAALAVVSNTRGFLPPSMTQATKFTISEPAGLTVYDETIGTPSYYTNNSNWFIPSWIKFTLGADDLSQGTMQWDTVSHDPSNRITYGSGIFTIRDIGMYVVLCSATLFITATSGPGERLVRVDFETVASVILASGISNIIPTESPSTFTNVNICYLLNNSTASGNYRFRFSSLLDASADLSAVTHGTIYRIT